MVEQRDGTSGGGEVETLLPSHQVTGGRRASRFSYSKLKDYETCPYRLVMRRTEKAKPTFAMSAGTEVHREIEAYLKGTGELKAEILTRWAPDLEELKRQNATSEEPIYVDETWKRTNEADWGVFILDAIVVTPPSALVIDFKTGKPSPISHGDQALLYACAVLSTRDDIERVTAEMWYLKSGERQRYELDRAGMERIKERTARRVKAMENDAELRPTPSRTLCKWCQYRESCPYSAVASP